MKTLKNFFKKIFIKKVKKIGMIKGIGYLPEDNYYIDEDVYFMGAFKLGSYRYWKSEDFKNGKQKRTIVKGFGNRIDPT